MLKHLSAVVLALSLGVASAPPVLADEGMWTFDAFPIQAANRATGASIDQAWLDRVQQGAVRLRGCSASVVSDQGLVVTNHHCVVSCVQALSDAQHDFVRDGFMSATREEERRCPGQTAEILTRITDVTERVQTAGAGLSGADFVRARAAEIEAIQTAACNGDPKRTCQVVTLFRGGRFSLYEYAKYEDVRLVFAPEFQAAFFGGDPDNFNFPRYALDVGFLRLYDDGKVVSTPQHLTWNPRAPRDGEATFIPGNPGSTQRLLTVAQMERLRDQTNPTTLIQSSELRGRLLQYAMRDDEAHRVSVDPIFSVENSFKVYVGQQGALVDPVFFGAREQAEADLRVAIASDLALAERTGDPWGEIGAAETKARSLYLPYRQLEQVAGQRSALYGFARDIVRMAKERAKPVEQRRAGYTDADLAALGRRLATAAPVETDLERIYLAFWLSKTREYLTVDDARVRALLGRESPEGLSERLVAGSKLGDPAFRAQALTMTPEQLVASGDPLLAFVVANDDPAQAVRNQWEAEVAGPTDRAAQRIAQARFALYGDALYPDATFSLRLSYGRVSGWQENGQTVGPFTQLGGLYERATGSAPFNAPARFLAAEDRVAKDTIYDFTTTNDIIGGNSGSPVLNAKGEVIGLAFDGNIHSLAGSFGYDAEKNRTIVVSAAAVTEALRNVYPSPALLRELGVRR
ncbi:MAG: S46 family peptidase [Brevundimonas sp.]|nr:MAG: S46 family peptidase [Brevundimonas sp.]